MSRVLFAGGGTGGHLYPALALAEALQAARPGLEVHFVGARRGVEARVLPQRGIAHTLLPFEPIYRSAIWRNAKTVSGLSRSFLGLARLFMKFRPHLVVATGGYASAPAGLMAAAVGVPLAVQEQNSYPGLTIRSLARFAAQVHLGFPEAGEALTPGRNTQVFGLGNPIQPPEPVDPAEARTHFGIPPTAKVLLVVGGSQGARAVNEALLGAIRATVHGQLDARPADMHILWATGPTHVEALQNAVHDLGATGWVHVVGYIEEMKYALAAADIAISRAGAMATAELLAWGVPAILVALPTAAADHQTHNARALAAAGAAIDMPERDLTPAGLWEAATTLMADDARRGDMQARALARAHPHAAADIAERLLALLESP